MTSPTRISIEDARRLAIHSSLLGADHNLAGGKDGIAQAIDHLGYVQIDTISVIERAHKHTIWNRTPDFSNDLLHELLAEDRRILEYWGHAHSYLPMKDFRYTLPLKERRANPTSDWHRRYMKAGGYLRDMVLERIRNEGPLSSKDFKDSESWQSGWGPSKHTSIALDLMFMEGQLMISERRNFQRYYDLAERVLPEGIDTSMPTPEEMGRYLVETTLRAYGLATAREIKDHVQLSKMKELVTALDRMSETGEILPLEVEGVEDEIYYAYPKTLEKLGALPESDSQVYILSPFDNLVIQRDRIERLFGFNYRLECYTPKDKRIYGYFVLPVLFGQQFAARLDAKNDRKKKTLIIRNLLLEPGFEDVEDFLPHLATAIREFASFNGCSQYEFENVNPVEIRDPLAVLLG